MLTEGDVRRIVREEIAAHMETEHKWREVYAAMDAKEFAEHVAKRAAEVTKSIKRQSYFRT